MRYFSIYFLNIRSKLNNVAQLQERAIRDRWRHTDSIFQTLCVRPPDDFHRNDLKVNCSEVLTLFFLNKTMKNNC